MNLNAKPKQPCVLNPAYKSSRPLRFRDSPEYLAAYADEKYFDSILSAKGQAGSASLVRV